jgi:hypothetical protein
LFFDKISHCLEIEIRYKKEIVWKREIIMEAIHQKSQLILEYEQRFTRVLPIKVLDKPQLHIWKIFIPIIFSSLLF